MPALIDAAALIPGLGEGISALQGAEFELLTACPPNHADSTAAP